MTGVGIIEVKGDRVLPVYFDAIKAGGGEFTERLGIIFTELRQLILEYKPDEAAIETVFVANNAASAIKLGQARGACLTALVANGLDVAEYTALQLKKAVVGYGRADKTQMQEMVKRLLSLPGLPGKDAADALGLCITHAQVARSVAAINKVSPLQAKTHAAYKGGRSY